MRIFVTIPVKLKNPKTRLSRYFDEDFRKKLVLAMLEDVLSACNGLDVVLISNEKPSIDFDFYFIKDNLSGLTNAVELGNNFAMKKGADATIFIPADVPLVKSTHIKEIIKAGERYNVVVARSSKNGVSAVLRRPPNIVELKFSNKSFIDITKRLNAIGMKPKIINNFNLWLDIDTIEDIKIFMKHGKGTKTYNILKDAL